MPLTAERAAEMNDQLSRLKETMRVLLAACALLVMLPCWGCRDKESEPEPTEQVAESNAPGKVAEKTTAPVEQPAVSLAKIPL